MRNYMIHEARSRQAYGRLTWVVRVLKNWRMRKSLRQLHCFTDYQLKNIGLTRYDLDRFVALPLTSDVIWETERLSLITYKSQINREPDVHVSKDASSPWLHLSLPHTSGDLRAIIKKSSAEPWQRKLYRHVQTVG